MSLDANLEKVLSRRAEIEARLAESGSLSPDEVMKLSRELAEIRPVADQAEKVRSMRVDLADARTMLDEAGDDDDTIARAEEEIRTLTGQLPEEEHKLPNRQKSATRAVLAAERIWITVAVFFRVSLLRGTPPTLRYFSAVRVRSVIPPIL